jgi:hypothetical protein
MRAAWVRAGAGLLSVSPGDSRDHQQTTMKVTRVRNGRIRAA